MKMLTINDPHESRSFPLLLGMLLLCSSTLGQTPSPEAANKQDGSRRVAVPEEPGPVGLPAPTGPFATGRMVFHWVDDARDEPDSEDPNDHRELLVYLWYPAEPGGTGRPAPYFPEREGLTRVLGEDALKTELGDAYGAIAAPVATHSKEDRAVVGDGHAHPILIFSHGLEEKSCFYTALLEDLASRGYVVAAIEHPYHGFGVVYPNGKTVTFHRKKWRSSRPRPRLDPQASERFELANHSMGAGDASFVLDQLGRLNSGAVPGAFAGRLDLSRCGVFGHSFGGFIAARAGALDPRFKACLNLDGSNNGRPFLTDGSGLRPTQPFMFLGSIFTGRNDRRNGPDQESLRFTESVFRSLPALSYRVTIEGFDHPDCTDRPILAARPATSAMSAKLREMQIVRTYLHAFFDKHLMENTVPLLDGPAREYPEVRIQRFDPPRP
jgi:predicted dienelactone hydrolase